MDCRKKLQLTMVSKFNFALIGMCLILSCQATPMFFGSGAVTAGGSGGSALSLNANWPDASCTNSGGCNATSSTQTFSGSGTIQMSFANTYTCQYSTNAVAFTTLTSG